MKIDSENVKNILTVVKAYVEGMEETVRIGDDGFQDLRIEDLREV